MIKNHTLLTKVENASAVLPEFHESIPGANGNLAVELKVFQIYHKNADSIGRHRVYGHERGVLFLMLGGECRVEIGEVTLTVRRGEGALIPPFTIHSFPEHKESSMVLISFVPGGDLQKLQSLGDKVLKFTRQEISCMMQGAEQFCKWFAGSRSAGASSRLHCELLLDSLIDRYVPHVPEMEDKVIPPHSYDLVTEALQYLEKHRDHRVTISELSQALKVSGSTLRSTFRKYMNRSVGHYEQMQRLNLAQRLLKSSSMTISQVAQSTGFSSESSLARAMRRAIGGRAVPTHIRRTGKSAEEN